MSSLLLLLLLLLFDVGHDTAVIVWVVIHDEAVI
jgi:hypothetical protein